MGRYTGPVCRLCRRAAQKLFLKGTRCDSPKCAVERRDSPPGMMSRRAKATDYGIHLREKQKVKQHYGVLERQFRRYFELATKSKGNTGNALLVLLERRLDSVMYRLGFGLSRAQARQLINHGNVLVNGKKVTIPSFLLRAGDTVKIKTRANLVQLVQGNLANSTRQVPDFLSVTGGDAPEGQLTRLPDASEASIPVQTQLIVELCSR